MYLCTWQRNMTTIMLPLHCDLQPQIPKHPITTHTWTHPKQLEATVTLWQRINARTHGKSQCFVLRLPPQQMSHATFMQPLQCVVQHHVAKSHVWTHMAVEHGNNHAAIAQRSAITDSKTSDNYATARCRTPCRNQKHQKERAHPHPMHTQAAFHRRLQPLYPKKQNIFSPAASHATFM